MTHDPGGPPGADPQNMLGVVRDSGRQWVDALAVARAQDVMQVSAPRAVIVAGMGGSGIAGDIACLAAWMDGSAPVVAVKGYQPPAWTGPNTPVIAVSHSGNTEETLALVELAAAAGAPVHVVTSGGQLGQRAQEAGWSATMVDGSQQPRASLPWLTAPVLVALATWGVVPAPDAMVRGLPDVLVPVVEDDLTEMGAGRRLAAQLLGHTGLFLGGRGVGALVAMRAACQVAENANEKAFSAEIPEFDHNALVGFSTPDSSERFVVASIRDPQEHPRVEARFEPTIEALRAGVAGAVEVSLVSGPWLHRLAAGVLTVDLASVHLALALRRDPTPVDVLVNLKQTLAGTP